MGDITVMATYTDAQMLEKVQTAIAAILDGAQSTSIGERVYTRASLATLTNLEQYYQSKIAAASTGHRTAAEF